MGLLLADQYHCLRKIVDSVEVGSDYVKISIKYSQLLNAVIEGSEKLTHLRIPVELKRCGYSMRLIITDTSKLTNLKDPYLIQHISKACQWLTLLTSGKMNSIKEIAQTEGVDQSHVTRMLNRAFLAPEIISAILNGTQPPHFNLKYLKQFRSLPTDWSEQKALLCFTQ